MPNQRATQKTNNAYLHLVQAQVADKTRISPNPWNGPIKSFQSWTVVLLSPQNENKGKSNVSPWLETFSAITANAEGIITSSGFSLRIRITVIYVWKCLNWLMHATLPEYGSFNRTFDILQATQKSWVQHVKTKAGNLISRHTVTNNSDPKLCRELWKQTLKVVRPLLKIRK